MSSYASVYTMNSYMILLCCRHPCKIDCRRPFGKPTFTVCLHILIFLIFLYRKFKRDPFMMCSPVLPILYLHVCKSSYFTLSVVFSTFMFLRKHLENPFPFVRPETIFHCRKLAFIHGLLKDRSLIFKM